MRFPFEIFQAHFRNEIFKLELRFHFRNEIFLQNVELIFEMRFSWNMMDPFSI